MKKITLLLIGLFITTQMFAQRAYVMWELMVDTLATSVEGNIVAFDQVLAGGLTIRDFNGSSVVGPAERLWYQNGSEWPNETAPNFSRYVEFKVAPKPGYNLIVDSVKYNMGSYGTRAYMHANIYWDTDPSFANMKIIDTTSAPIIDFRDSAYYRAFKIGTKVNDGSSFILRFFPWYSTTGGVTKYFCLNNVEIVGSTESAVSVDETNVLPVEFELKQNYPNPFNPTTTISFSIAKQGYVNLSVYNSLGEKIATLISKELNAGYHAVIFDASNLSSGVYFYRLEADGFNSVKKMILAK